MSSIVPPPNLRRDAQLGRKLCTKCKGSLPKRSDVKGEYHKPYPYATCPFCRSDARINRAFERAAAEKAIREYDAARAEPATRVVRTVVIDGRTFDVLFDGT